MKIVLSFKLIKLKLEKMDTERKEQNEDSKIQEKNREDLASYQELLKKELNSIRNLVGSESTENNATKVSTITSAKVISPVEYEKLKEENRTLRFKNNSLTSANSVLKNENRLLRENIETLKLENSNRTELENEITRLKEVIFNLEKERLEIGAKEIEKISKEEELYNQDLPVDISNEVKTLFKSKEPAEPSTPQIHKGFTVPPIKPKKFKRKTTPKPEEKIPEDFNSIPSEDSTTFSELDSEKIIEETVRRKCPTCLNTNKKFIREFNDKSNILMQYPRIYGKKYKCGICRTEWK
ncbi:hypothetical protein LCGC14_1352720 [marine sediment metagenome]|uniref:Uncharacterized protein n=1 Tax=marine sediment metagenome TaxID=412755 RepID=A0A0F9MR19_9ZZZZ